MSRERNEERQPCKKTTTVGMKEISDNGIGQRQYEVTWHLHLQKEKKKPQLWNKL